MGILSFSKLVEAIARSVAKAQDQVEKHQIANLESYFDKDKRPHSLLFRVPPRESGQKDQNTQQSGQKDQNTQQSGQKDQNTQQKDAYDAFYKVPYLSLVSINVLKIKDVEIKFSVDMGEETEEEEKSPTVSDSTDSAGVGQVARPNKPDPMKTLKVSTTTGRGGGKVRVSLRVEGSEPSEGAARLLDYLAQMQGEYPEDEKPEISTAGDNSSPDDKTGKS